MPTHYCKSWAHFYDAIEEGRKTHDLRLNDRDYQVGDYICLQRYDFIEGRYTGPEQWVEITYLTSNVVPCAYSSSALHRDYVILSIRKIDDPRD